MFRFFFHQGWVARKYFCDKHLALVWAFLLAWDPVSFTRIDISVISMFQCVSIWHNVGSRIKTIGLNNWFKYCVVVSNPGWLSVNERSEDLYWGHVFFLGKFFKSWSRTFGLLRLDCCFLFDLNANTFAQRKANYAFQLRKRNLCEKMWNTLRIESGIDFLVLTAE